MSENGTEEKETIVISYRPSRLFRVIRVDGAWGGATPFTDIQMGIYSERLSMPDSETYEVVNGQIGGRLSVEQQTSSPIREMEAMLSMSIPVARAVARWLTSKADEIERAIEAEQTETEKITLTDEVVNDVS